MKFRSSRHCFRRHIHNRLRFESLEKRLALATHVWTGAISNLWSNSGNWNGGSPAGDSQAVLSFPSAANVANNNDLVGLKVAALDFAAGNYVLSGNPITLVQGPQGIPRLHMDAAAKTNTIAIDLVRAATNIGITADIASGSTLTLSGVISGGAAATNITKEGPGKLVLAGANTFADGVLISAGVLNIQNGTALGTTDIGVTNKTTLNGGTLELQGSLFVTETIGQGASGGTLRNVSGNSRWAGEVILASTDLTAQVDPGSSLTIDGKISDNAAGAGLGVTKTGQGTLALTAANTYRGATLVSGGVLSISNPSALGTADGGTTVENFSRLELQGFITVAEPLVLDKANLFNRSGNNVWQGTVALVNSTGLDVEAGTLTISGAIGGSAGFALSSAVPANLVLSGANTFTGPVIVEGILNIRHPLALGAAGGSSVSVRDGGTLELELPGTGSFSRSLNLLGQGVGAKGALRNLSGNNTWAGPVRPNITNSTLIARLNFFPLVGTGFRIIDNTSTVADSGINGRFVNLPEGAIISTAFANLRISYFGGDGNDVVLAVVSSPLVIPSNTPSRFPDRSITPVIDEGGVATLTGTISDPDLHDVFFLDVDWGDGTPTEKHVFPPGSNGQLVQLTHRYLDDEPAGTPQDDYHIQLVWHDKAGQGSSATLTTTVRNVAPVVTAVPDVQLHASGLLHQLVTFTDPGRDKWTATVDFGDGTGPQPVNVQGGKQLLLHHRYQQPGTYLVKVVVTDDDGGVDKTSFRVRWDDRLNPSRVDAFFEWLDDYEQKNKPRRTGLR